MPTKGKGLSLSTLTVGGLDQPGEIQGGGVASVSGIVYNLDGAAFTVEVNWGDGDNGQADTEDFLFAASHRPVSRSLQCEPLLRGR